MSALEPIESDQASFVRDLAALLNRHSSENGSNTPDFILAEFMCSAMVAFNGAVNDRKRWYGTKITRERVLQAVARGWCDPSSAQKQMDPDLAEAIADAVCKKFQIGVARA